MAVNYATQYQSALQQQFTSALRFGALFATPNNSLVRWTGAKTIQVPNITTGGYVDVNRDAVTGFTRRVDNNWTALTLEHDREFSTLVDPMDIDETNMALSIANITRVFNSEHKIPEMDKYAASKLFAEYIGAGETVDETVLDAASILTVFDTMMENMDEAEVPTEGRILYLTPTMNTVLKNADKVQKSIINSAQTGSANRNVRSIDEVTIVTVPSSRMKTAYNFTDGAVADPTARQINMILIHPVAVYTPQKYEFVSIDEPSAKTGGKNLYYERKYWDLFIVEQKAAGIQMAVTAAG